MAKPVATQEAVFAAADALVAEGKEPRMTLVQERTGGSYTTVKRHLEAWEAKRKGEIAAVDLPADIEARGRDFVRALYAHALHGAKEAVAEPLALAEASRPRDCLPVPRRKSPGWKASSKSRSAESTRSPSVCASLR